MSKNLFFSCILIAMFGLGVSGGNASSSKVLTKSKINWNMNKFVPVPNKFVEGCTAENADCKFSFLPILIGKPIPIRIVHADTRSPKYPPPQIVGEVINISDRTVYNVSLKGQVSIPESSNTHTYTGTLALPATFPNETNLFAIDTDLPLEYWHGSLSVIVEAWSYEHDPEYLPVTVVSIFPDEAIPGEIRNDNNVTLTDIQVVIYNLDWPDYYVYAEVEQTTLSPGESTYYEFWTGGSPYLFPRVWAQGAIAP